MKLKIQLLMVWSGISCMVNGQEILVQPYLQPGNASTLSKEQKVVIWQTDSVPGTYKVEFAPGPSLASAKKVSNARISSTPLRAGLKASILYHAPMTGLDFDKVYAYRVSSADKIIYEGTFSTRTKKPSVRFVALGDCGTGSPEQKALAYQMSLQKPQFVLVVGDNVYSSGLLREYQVRFFPIYGAAEASPQTGAPLMKSIPFYMLLGNHDVQGNDLDKTPGGLAFFYFNDLPQNAPVPERVIKAKGNPETVKTFQKATNGRFPGIANYSFDYGNIHFVCLDASPYVNPLDPYVLEWMRAEMATTRADWKIVAYHHGAFNGSKTHYDYQYLRLLSPVLEEMGVDMVLNGHVHNYQRTKPLKFVPKKNEAGDHFIISDEGRVDGKFTLDEKFDGVTHTKPDGIIYIVTGAGGAGLYDAGLSNKPELWKHEPPDNWVPYTVKLISDVHSFTLIETEGKTLILKQLDTNGSVLDEIKMTK